MLKTHKVEVYSHTGVGFWKPNDYAFSEYLFIRLYLTCLLLYRWYELDYV